MEYKLRGLLDNVNSLLHYVQEYSQRNLYDEDKHNHLVDQILLQHPYLDPITLETLDVELIFQWQKILRPSILVISNTIFPFK
jgi:hypothetical protein